jgi:GNAT superfamily N-acetyltransferase
MKVDIRLRNDGDLVACVELLHAVHVADGYPDRWPEDPSGWITPRGLLAAWVAVRDGSIVGHVSLRSSVPEHGVQVWAQATGVGRDGLACIARLFIAPGARRAGLGAALLDTACARARTEGRVPVLDVMDSSRSAIDLYERRGWRRVGSVAWADGVEARRLYYYVAPPEAS